MVDTALQVFRARQATGHTTVVVFYRGERSFFCRQWLKRWLSIPAIERRFDLADVFLLFVSSQSQGKAYSVADQFTSHASLIDRRVFFYGDPEHLLVNYLIDTSISRPVITNPDSHRAHGWVFDFGMVQPAIVALGADCAILYEWSTKPSLRNVAGKLDRPDPWDVWDRIERRLDRIRITKARAARKNLVAALPAPLPSSHLHKQPNPSHLTPQSQTSELPENAPPLLLADPFNHRFIDVKGLPVLPGVHPSKSSHDAPPPTFPPITDSMVASVSILPNHIHHDSDHMQPVAAPSESAAFSPDPNPPDVDHSPHPVAPECIAAAAIALVGAGTMPPQPADFVHTAPTVQIADVANPSVHRPPSLQMSIINTKDVSRRSTKDISEAFTSSNETADHVRPSPQPTPDPPTASPKQLEDAIRQLEQTVKADVHAVHHHKQVVANVDKHSHKFIQNVSKGTILDNTPQGAASHVESASEPLLSVSVRPTAIDSESTVTDSEESAINSALHAGQGCSTISYNLSTSMVMKGERAEQAPKLVVHPTLQRVAFPEDEDLEPSTDEISQVRKSPKQETSGRFPHHLSSNSFDMHQSTGDHMDTSVASVGSDQVEISIPISKHESVRTEDSSQANTLNFEHHVLLGHHRASQSESDERGIDMSEYLTEMKDPMKRVRSNMMTMDGEHADRSTGRDSEGEGGGEGSGMDGEMICNDVVANTVSGLDAEICDRLSTEEEGNTLKPANILIPTTDSPHPEAATPRGPTYDMSPFADAEHELLSSGQLFEGGESTAARRDEYEAYDEYIVCEYEVEEYVEEYESDTLSKSRIFKNVIVEEDEDLNGGSTADVSAVVTNALAGKGGTEMGDGEEYSKDGDDEEKRAGGVVELDGDHLRHMGSVRSALRKIGGRQKRNGREDRDVEEGSIEKGGRKDTLRSVLRKGPGKGGEEGEGVETMEDVECSSKLGRKETLKSVLRKIPVPKNLKRHHTLADSSETVGVASTPAGSTTHTPLKTPSRHTSLPRSNRGEREVIEIDSGDENGRIVRKDTLRAALRNLSFARHSDVGVETPKLSGVSECASHEERRGEGLRMLKRLPGSYDGVFRRVGEDSHVDKTLDSGEGQHVERREGIAKSLSDRQADTPGTELQITDGVTTVKKSKFRRTLSRLRHSALRSSDVAGGVGMGDDDEDGERRRRRTRDREDFRMRGRENGEEEGGEKVSGKMSFAMVGEKILSKLKHVSGSV